VCDIELGWIPHRLGALFKVSYRRRSGTWRSHRDYTDDTRSPAALLDLRRAADGERPNRRFAPGLGFRLLIIRAVERAPPLPPHPFLICGWSASSTFRLLSLQRQVCRSSASGDASPPRLDERVEAHFGSSGAPRSGRASSGCTCPTRMLSGLAWLGRRTVGSGALIGFANARSGDPLALYFRSCHGRGTDKAGSSSSGAACSVFLAPPLTRPVSGTRSSEIAIWLFRWLAFRIMLAGAHQDPRRTPAGAT